MALSSGGLAAIILFLILLHGGAFAGYYVYKTKQQALQQQEGNEGAASKFAVSNKIQGIFRWALVGLIPLSWILSIVATASCTFLTLSYSYSDGVLGQTWSGGLGLNSVDYGTGTCHSDGSTVPTAFSFAVFNCILTTIGMIGVILMQFVLSKGRKRTWLALRIVMYISMWCALFTFHLKASTVCSEQGFECSLGGAGIAQVFNILFLIAITVMLFLTDFGEESGLSQARNKSQKLEDDDVEQAPQSPLFPKVETETHLPDGTIEREVEETNPDGSKTVTRTIEKPSESADSDDDDFVKLGEDSASSSGEDEEGDSRSFSESESVSDEEDDEDDESGAPDESDSEEGDSGSRSESDEQASDRLT